MTKNANIHIQIVSSNKTLTQIEQIRLSRNLYTMSYLRIILYRYLWSTVTPVSVRVQVGIVTQRRSRAFGVEIQQRDVIKLTQGGLVFDSFLGII